MADSVYQAIQNSLRRLYVEDHRPWLVGFSGGKDSTMIASLIVETIAGIPVEQRKKEVAILCTDTRVEAESDETRRCRFRRNQPPLGTSPLYPSASNGVTLCHSKPVEESQSYPFAISPAPSCGNSRFGCWACTVVERDNIWMN